MQETRKVILFQGDSITDVARTREDPDNLGQGYPSRVSGRLGLENPGKYKFYNRGISGDRIVDIYARMMEDIVTLKPDYMSILAGINGVWKGMWGHGVSASKFKKVYRILLEELLAEFPDLKIMLLEPFVLPGLATENDLERFTSETYLRAQAVKELAEEFGLVFIPLQEDLNRLLEKAPAEYWLFDGVHPTPFFDQYIADKWIEAFAAME